MKRKILRWGWPLIGLGGLTVNLVVHDTVGIVIWSLMVAWFSFLALVGYRPELRAPAQGGEVVVVTLKRPEIQGGYEPVETPEHSESSAYPSRDDFIA